MSAKTEPDDAANRDPAPPRREPTHDETAFCAMTIWIEEGRPQGRDLEHWLLAETRLRQALQVEAEAASGRRPRRNAGNGARRRQPEGAVL
ncbi:MAG: DUF2934 domain-containing protein [Limisphaerales bacterium]